MVDLLANACARHATVALDVDLDLNDALISHQDDRSSRTHAVGAARALAVVATEAADVAGAQDEAVLKEARSLHAPIHGHAETTEDNPPLVASNTPTTGDVIMSAGHQPHVVNSLVAVGAKIAASAARAARAVGAQLPRTAITKICRTPS